MSISPAPPPPPMPKPKLVKFPDIKFFPPPQNNMQVLFFPPVDLCEWAKDDQELKDSCIRNSVCMCKAPYKYKYRHFENIPQVGPTCGLVALSMLVNGKISPEEILNKAIELGYTHNGEMFSCKQLYDLAKEVFKMADADNLNLQLQIGDLYSQEIVDKLLDGAALLVPYDADYNHLPCLRNGHTAHWALICGVVVAKDREFGLDSLNVQVLAKHGKSKYLGAWPLEDLANSNGNLFQFSPKKKEDGLKYVLPEGGIGGENGLKDQFLIVDGF